MRLFEVDLGSARSVLAVFQGAANKKQIPAEIPFPAVMKMIRPFALGISDKDGLVALKNEIDPAGDVIADILDDGTVILNTATPSDKKSDTVEPNTGPSVDKMASSGSKKLSPDI